MSGVFAEGAELARGYRVVCAPEPRADARRVRGVERRARLRVRRQGPAARQARRSVGTTAAARRRVAWSSDSRHPHIVRAYELIERPQLVLVLEALTGETLAYTIEERAIRLPTAEIAALGLHLCSAIAYVHRQGVLHLDLKPSNVVGERGQAKLIDFSIARPPGPRAPLGRDSGVHGARAEERRRAHRGDRRLGDRRRALRGGYRSRANGEPVRRLRRLPFAAAIDACLAADPKERPGVAELMTALDAYA